MSPDRPNYKQRAIDATNAATSISEKARTWEKVATNRMAMLMDIALEIDRTLGLLPKEIEGTDAPEFQKPHDMDLRGSASDGLKLVREIMSGITCIKDYYDQMSSHARVLVSTIDTIATNIETTNHNTLEGMSDLHYISHSDNFSQFMMDPESAPDVGANAAMRDSSRYDNSAIRDIVEDVEPEARPTDINPQSPWRPKYY